MCTLGCAGLYFSAWLFWTIVEVRQGMTREHREKKWLDCSWVIDNFNLDHMKS